MVAKQTEKTIYRTVDTQDKNTRYMPDTTRSQAVSRIADRTAKNCRGHVT